VSTATMAATMATVAGRGGACGARAGRRARAGRAFADQWLWLWSEAETFPDRPINQSTN